MQKVLIVDDSAAMRESFIAILSALTECHTVANGQEAVDRVKAIRKADDYFDIIIMDIIMPEKDGLTAVKEIRRYEQEREWHPDDSATIVIVTTITDPSRILMAQYECGADAYITKPFTEETVLQTLSNNGLNITLEHDIDPDVDMEDQNQWSYSK